MKSAKDEVRDLIERLPATATLSDIQYSIYVRQKVEKAQEAARRGQVISRPTSNGVWHDGSTGRMERTGLDDLASIEIYCN